MAFRAAYILEFGGYELDIVSNTPQGTKKFGELS